MEMLIIIGVAATVSLAVCSSFMTAMVHRNDKWMADFMNDYENEYKNFLTELQTINKQK